MVDCGVFDISCGSIIVNTTIKISNDKNYSPTNAAPANTEEFLSQISGIRNANEFGKFEMKTICHLPFVICHLPFVISHLLYLHSGQ